MFFLKNIIFILIVNFMLFTIFLTLQMKKNETMFIKNCFECGFNSKNKTHNSFSFNYFFMTIIFLIFDLEVLMIMPMIVFNVKNEFFIMMSYFMAVFMFILIMEWNNSMLDWNKNS